MKTTLTILFTLLLLASCATVKQVTPGNPAPGLQGVCSANDGILVILVDNTGSLRELVCKDIGGKPITKQPKPTPGLNPAGRITLGEVEKLKANPNDADPCIEWTIGGNKSSYCWQE